MWKLILFLLCTMCLGQSVAMYKRWRPDTNFENPRNWNVKRAPCGNDLVIIPEESPVVYMQANSTLRELVLPKDGELLLGSNVAFYFSETKDSNCPEAHGDVEFSAVNPEPWFNPNNWCPTYKQRGVCTDSRSVLDVEKVPCTYDDVVFARGHGFYVNLTQVVPGTTVKSVRLMGSSFTTASLNSFSNSTEGQRMFEIPPGRDTNLQVSRKSCEDRGGCSCGNDKPQTEKKICAFISKKCRRPKCRRTIQPIGDCCRKCGVVFNMTKDYGFDFNDFNTTLQKEFFAKSKDVFSILSVMTGGWLQLVLSDRTGQLSKKLAEKIERALQDDINDGGHKFAIKSFKLSLATREPDSAKSTSPQLGAGSVAGIVIGIILLLCLLLIVAIFVYRRNGHALPSLPSMPPMPSLPSFPRGLVPNFRRPPRQRRTIHTASHIDPGFANPMFDSAPLDDSEFTMKEMAFVGPMMKEEQPTFESAGFQNPLYTGGKKSGAKFIDPTQGATPGDEATSSGQAATPKAGASSGPSASSKASEAAVGTLVDLQSDSLDKDSTI